MFKNYPKLYLGKVSFCFSTCMSVCFSLHIPNYQCNCLSVGLSICTSVCLSVGLFVILSLCSFIHLYNFLSVHLSVFIMSAFKLAGLILIANMQVAFRSASLSQLSWHHYNYINDHLAIFSTLSAQRTKVIMSTSSRQQKETVLYLLMSFVDQTIFWLLS